MTINSLNINNDDKQFKTSSYAFIIMQIFLCIYKITIDDPFIIINTVTTTTNIIFTEVLVEIM